MTSNPPSPPGSFQYVRIPADVNEPIEVLTGDKSGGLEHDKLVQSAKEYFWNTLGGHNPFEPWQNILTGSEGGPERHRAVEQIRQSLKQHYPASQGMQWDSLDDETILQFISNAQQQQQQPSCEITALTVPVPANNYQAVSLYAASDTTALPLNPRATALVTACGHAAMEIRGDIFVGRAHDNEDADIWERVDFNEQDANPSAAWCRVARSAGGGGGQSGKAAASLSGLVAQSTNGVNVMTSIPASQQQSSNYGMNGSSPMMESWGSWTQTSEEVELKLIVPLSTKGKDCKIRFSRNSLTIHVGPEERVAGALFDPVDADECTFTLQDSGDGTRELCVTLIKAASGRTWPMMFAGAK